MKRGDIVLVWNGIRKSGSIRIFDKMDCGNFVCVLGEHNNRYLNGHPYETTQWKNCIPYVNEPVITLTGAVEHEAGKFEKLAINYIGDSKLNGTSLESIDHYIIGFAQYLDQQKKAKKSKWVPFEATQNSVCPIDGEAFVKIQLRGGRKCEATHQAMIYNWTDSSIERIVAYKVVKD